MVVSEQSLPVSLREADASTRFFTELFRHVGNVDVSRIIETDRTEVPREERIVKGYCGTPTVGYRWVETVPLDSSMFPFREEETTYGLSGMDITWEYRLAKDGQLGYRLYRHRSLRVRFDSSEARAAFIEAWRATFGCEPTFEAATSE